MNALRFGSPPWTQLELSRPKRALLEPIQVLLHMEHAINNGCPSNLGIQRGCVLNQDSATSRYCG